MENKPISYGTIPFGPNSPLGEIDNMIGSLGIEMHLLAENEKQYDRKAFEEEHSSEFSDSEMKERYEEHCKSLDDSCDNNKENISELKKELTEKMNAYPQKDILKKFLEERESFFIRRMQNETEDLYLQDALYERRATTQAQNIYTFKIERNKNA